MATVLARSANVQLNRLTDNPRIYKNTIRHKDREKHSLSLCLIHKSWDLKSMISERDFQQERLANYMHYVPYYTTFNKLYSAKELYKGFDPEDNSTFATCYDQQVYKHFLEKGKRTMHPLELVSRGIHDLCITEALNQVLERYEKKKVVAVMGGSAMLRTDKNYRDIVNLSKQLTEQGTLMISGGGSGAMEATALGGLLAGYSEKAIDHALQMLSVAPSFACKGYINASFDVLNKYPQKPEYESLTIPTWLYGHEPTTPFAKYIAKYFDNSIREETLLSVSYGGIIFTPGSAGTMQEIFQEAVQNHYLVYDLSSPMVFLNTKFWTHDMPVYPFLRYLSETGKYRNLMLHITDDPQDVVQIIKDFQEKK